MISWETYFRVIKQTPVHNAVYPYSKDDWRYYDKQEEINMNDTCLVIEMSTGTGAKGGSTGVHREWEFKYSGQKYCDTTRWLFSEGKLVGCAYGCQDWFASDYDCGDPKCEKEYGNSAHSRNCNAFCSNDDGFSVTSLQLSLMFAKELHRITGAYIDAVETDHELYELIHTPRNRTKGGA